MKKFDLADVLLTPAVKTPISSRSEVLAYTDSEMLPLITAPMDTVISKDNWYEFYKNGITPCLPRGINFSSQEESDMVSHLYPIFVSYSLSEVESSFFSPLSNYICIDVANGHMERLHKAVTMLKEKWGKNVVIMTGNIAHPLTYKVLAEAGADLIRVNIGTGNACLTSKQTSIGYPMGSLITECRKIKKEYNLSAEIIADGGMKDYSDIIKALALGADRVMIGSLFNFCIESAGDNYFYGVKIPQKLASWAFKKGFRIEKKYRGMSTKEVQKAWGKSELRTSEGIVTRRRVRYDLPGWCTNFRHYLESTMSYTGKRNLKEFIGETEYTLITPNVYRRFNK
jgi:IMP dehydrogenase/GMP reductase